MVQPSNRRLITEDVFEAALAEKAPLNDQVLVTEIVAGGPLTNSTFLRGDGFWAVPPGSGGGGGGGPADDPNAVKLTGNQTVDGIKTFTSAPAVPASSFAQDRIVGLPTALSDRALDADVVHDTGNETIAGVKTFSSNPIVNDGAFAQSKIVNLTTDLGNRALDADVVHDTGNETIAGVKTFSANPIVNEGAFAQSKIVNLTTDLGLRALDADVVHDTGAETIAGVKTFSATPVVPDASFTMAKLVESSIIAYLQSVGWRLKLYWNTGTDTWPARTLPAGYAGLVEWWSNNDPLAPAPPASLDGDIWWKIKTA